MERKEAEIVGLRALAFVAGDTALLDRFMALTGLDEATLRASAGEASFLAGILDFLMGHEPDLLRFCDEAGIAPTDPGRARHALQ